MRKMRILHACLALLIIVYATPFRIIGGLAYLTIRPLYIGWCDMKCFINNLEGEEE